MFYSCDDKNIRYTGRWGDWGNDGISAGNVENVRRITATACGAKISLMYKGRDALLHFDTETNCPPYPHLYISVDGGARVETPLYRLLRVHAENDGTHGVEIIYKSAVERQHRWHMPLNGKITFLGVTAEALIPLPESGKKTIEFIGDSITEGVLVDADLSNYLTREYRPFLDAQENRPFLDDVTATYAYLTAEALNLEPYFMGYGAVGITRSGMGGVPKAADAYPYAFENVKKTCSPCDYILVNHGANDGGASSEEYTEQYGEFLDLLRAFNPRSVIVVLSAFCGNHHVELGKFIEKYNKSKSENIRFIDSTGWTPKGQPFHPLRDGHRAIADRLIEKMREIIR